MLRDHVEVVRDEDDGHVLLLAQLRHDLIEELETVLVDAGDRLVEQQEIRHRIEREREQYALQLAA